VRNGSPFRFYVSLGTRLSVESPIHSGKPLFKAGIVRSVRVNVNLMGGLRAFDGCDAVRFFCIPRCVTEGGYRRSGLAVDGLPGASMNSFKATALFCFKFVEANNNVIVLPRDISS